MSYYTGLMTYTCHYERINSLSLFINSYDTHSPQWEKHWTQCYNIVKNHDST